MSSTKFNAKSTAMEVLADVNIAGKTFFVTGGTAGIGLETVRVLATKNATVYFTARDAKKVSVFVIYIQYYFFIVILCNVAFFFLHFC